MSRGGAGLAGWRGLEAAGAAAGAAVVAGMLADAPTAPEAHDPPAAADPAVLAAPPPEPAPLAAAELLPGLLRGVEVALSPQPAPPRGVIMRSGFEPGDPWGPPAQGPPVRVALVRDASDAATRRLWVEWRLERPVRSAAQLVRFPGAKGAVVLGGAEYQRSSLPTPAGPWANLLEQRGAGPAGCPCLFEFVEPDGRAWRAGWRRAGDPPLPAGWADLAAWTGGKR